jgi:hypothetical protein
MLNKDCLRIFSADEDIYHTENNTGSRQALAKIGVFSEKDPCDKRNP